MNVCHKHAGMMVNTLRYKNDIKFNVCVNSNQV